MARHDETSPLLGDLFNEEPDQEVPRNNLHSQFCKLVGIPSSAGTGAALKHNKAGSQLLYERAVNKRRQQQWAYGITASVSNVLLLSQVVLGAALTGLGASESSHVLITVFGALNTVIAGLVAYLKSRGQPMRARMFRDDLDRVVDEIENSEIMWLGISRNVHGKPALTICQQQRRHRLTYFTLSGYDEIDVENDVSVRSEVARLTRLYDRAIRNSTQNNPDMYMAGGVNMDQTTGLRNRPGPQMTLPALPAAPVTDAAPSAGTAPPPPAETPVAADPDQSPATAAPKPEEPGKPASGGSATPAAAPPPTQPVAADPDASPATMVKPKAAPAKADGGADDSPTSTSSKANSG